MSAISKATLESISTKDYPAIMACLCDPERGPEQQYIYQCFKKLSGFLSMYETFMETKSETLYDFSTLDIRPSQHLLDFIRIAMNAYSLEISDPSNPEDLLAISFLLPELEYLNLICYTTIHLDRFLARFPKLTHIDIENCSIEMPKAYVLPQLPLEDIRFERNNLTSLPKGIENLRQLRSFSCVNNQLTEFPHELTSLPLLWSVELQRNRITGMLPKEIGHLTNLKHLSIENNQLQDIQHLEQLPKLSILSLEDNQVQDIRALERLPELSTLQLRGNPLSALPRQLPAIKQLTIDADQFHLMHDLFPACPQLEFLYIREGSIPVDLRALQQNTQLLNLFVYYVDVVGLEAVSNFSRLERLCLSRTHLQHDLSPIFSLSKLKELNLDDNDLPELPDRFAELPNLETIHLGGNRLKELPPSLLHSKVRRWGRS